MVVKQIYVHFRQPTILIRINHYNHHNHYNYHYYLVNGRIDLTTMAGLKRQSEGGPARGIKRPRQEDGHTNPPSGSTDTTTNNNKPASSQPRPVFASALLADEGDFPRGGGTTLTPLEYKEVRDEGRKEAEKDVEAERKKRRLTQNRRNKGKSTMDDGKKGEAMDKDAIREYQVSVYGGDVTLPAHTENPRDPQVSSIWSTSDCLPGPRSSPESTLSSTYT